MARYVGPIQEIGRTIEQQAGPDVARQVMEGSDAITDSSKPPKVAAWMKGAMERLDTLVNEDTRQQIMIQCGYNCTRVNKGAIEKAQARRRKYPTEDAFLEAEQKNPSAGTRLSRDGDILYQYYTPRSFTHPMRCYCSLWRGLPDDQTTSATYCHCSQGFVQVLWESALGHPVTVDVVESVIAGADECKFVIHLKPTG